MKGKIVPKVPPANAREGLDYDWDALAKEALEHPDAAVLAATHIPVSQISAIRQYKRYPFMDDSGHRLIAVRMRNSSRGEDGRRYGDVYFERAA